MAVVVGLPGHLPFDMPDGDLGAADYYRALGAVVRSGSVDDLDESERAVFVPLGEAQNVNDGAYVQVVNPATNPAPGLGEVEAAARPTVDDVHATAGSDSLDLDTDPDD